MNRYRITYKLGYLTWYYHISAKNADQAERTFLTDYIDECPKIIEIRQFI
ncbi:hypothetical protein [Moraxella boevrei]